MDITFSYIDIPIIAFNVNLYNIKNIRHKTESSFHKKF